MRGVHRTVVVLVAALALASLAGAAQDLPASRLERLDRGVIALRAEAATAFLSWRLLATDDPQIRFHVYRQVEGAAGKRLTGEPLASATCFQDGTLPTAGRWRYEVRPVVGGKESAGAFSEWLSSTEAPRAYLSVSLQTPQGYTPNDAAVADLDGDGRYEIILKQELRGYDNSQRGVCPGTTRLEAYRLTGERLWQIDLGRNVREGAHYTPFVVADFDGNGRAEVAVRTAEGTVDGTGVRIGDVNGDGRTDYVNPETGYILEGPEFLSLFEGATGKELSRIDYLPRGRVADWGDTYGNRVDRFLMGVGSFDGALPSILMCRGYYTITKLEAVDWRGGKLTRRWLFDTAGKPDLSDYEGQGNHNLSVGDVDGDGRDEVVYGAMCVDDDGRPRYTTRLGHGDAIHLSDLDPTRAGLEVFDIHEEPKHPHGIEFRDAASGQLLWSKPSPDVGRGVAFDIDPTHPGAECWAAGPGLDALYSCRGEAISQTRPRSCNFGIWWDGDPLRELLDRNQISKWDWKTGTEQTLLRAEGCSSNNGTKATPALCADILGDWREEVIWRTLDGKELRIYSTTLPTDHRLPTLMHDPMYRNSVHSQNVGYNQPPHPSFFLADRVAGKALGR